MIRILTFLVVVFALGLSFAWLADRPGDLVLTFGGYQYRVSLMAAAVAVVAIVAAVMLVWWLFKSIWNSPYMIARYFRVRRRDRGYQALSTGMVAAGAGDAALARRMSRQAGKLIRAETEPLIQLLDAQASLLEGDHASVRKKFEAMLDDPEMRLIGLRGLYLEAERLGDRAAARHYAGRAGDIAPQLAWAAESTMEQKVAAGDWDGALKLVEALRASRQIEPQDANRRRAVLLTAKAQDIADTDQAGARAAALEANRLDPRFVPAALAAAKSLFRQDETRKGAKLLEAAWRAEPHPEVGDLYVHARPGDSALDRLARARKLQGLRGNNVDSAMIVARAALAAGDHAAARTSAEAAIRMEPRESAWLLLADIEEAETGDQGRVRQYLAKALRAPRDPAWVADGFVSEHWMPVSPVSGRLGAFEWRAPVERLGAVIENEPELPALAAPREEMPPDEPEPEEAIIDLTPVAAPPPLATAAPPALVAAAPAPVVPANDVHKQGEPAGPGEVAPPPLPDDPGVDPRETGESRRFRLF